MRLADKVAVVTGATTGIGQVIARRFAAEGASLIVNGRNRQAGARLVDELRSAGTSADFVCGDVADEATADSIADTARARYGRIDTMMLNAGVVVYGNFWELTPEEFDLTMGVNVRGPWLCARAAVPLLPDGASIVLMGSVSSFMIPPGESVYCASKAAVVQLAKAIAGDLAHRGIRANALCPGAVGEVGMMQAAIAESDDGGAGVIEEVKAITPLDRMATPTEIANGALFLASSESSYMTGASLVLDGGILIR
jgi:NAD(P)-dependent dehydrogenase (short-subunit alcohol dehydrogenase family)